MLVLMNQIFTDFMDSEIKDEKGTPFTLKIASINALVAAYEDEKNLSGEEKLKRFELAMTIKNGVDPLEITAEDVSLIKKLIAKAFSTIIVGQAWKMLEGK